MPKILTTTTDGLPAEPVEDAEVQKLIEQVETEISTVEGLVNEPMRTLSIDRKTDGRRLHDGLPYVRCEANVCLEGVMVHDGSGLELYEAIRDELCAMFQLKRLYVVK